MKAYGIPCSLCGGIVQVKRASKKDGWLCVSSAQCNRRMTELEKMCSCNHRRGQHYPGVTPGLGTSCPECREGKCKAFSLKKIPSAAGSAAAKKAWVTIRSKKAAAELERLEKEGTYIHRNIELL